jgi:hypothetical protein
MSVPLDRGLDVWYLHRDGRWIRFDMSRRADWRIVEEWLSTDQFPGNVVEVVQA